MFQSQTVAMATLLSVLAIVDIVGNFLVCMIIKRNREMRIPINSLLVNLAIADILYATFILPEIFFKVTSSHPDGMIGTILCKFISDGNIAWVGAASSILTLVVIAIERYYAVMYPLGGSKWELTKAKLKVIITGSWVFSIILNIPDFTFADIKKKKSGYICVNFWPEDWMEKAYTLIWLALVVVSMVLMIGLYSRVVYSLWFKQNNDNPNTNQGVMRLRKRVTKMVVVVTVIFGICWGTNEVVSVLNYVISYKTGFVPLAVANTMVLFNSAVNPFVYALLNKQYREKIKGMLCCSGSSALRVLPLPANRAQVIELATTSPTYPCTNNLSTEAPFSLG